MPRRRSLLAVPAAALLGAAGLAGCSSGSSSGEGGKTTLRLGYFPNVTHAVPLVGIGTGTFRAALGADTKLETTSFNAGPDAVTALLSGSIDAAYVGPNPTVNAWAQSHGKAVEVIAGAASGGVALAVRTAIKKWSDLAGADIATPQLGNTQDVSARYFLKQHGLSTTKSGGGDVHIKPMSNGAAVTAFKSGAVDGAWLPEPYASQIVDAGGHVLADERSLWPDGKFVVTDLLVRKDFVEQHPDTVTRLLRGQVRTVDRLTKDPAKAQQVVSEQIGKVSGKALDISLVKKAWAKIEFTNDPLASTLAAGAKHAESVGLLDPVDLTGIYHLDPLNAVLKAAGESTVSASLS